MSAIKKNKNSPARKPKTSKRNIVSRNDIPTPSSIEVEKYLSRWEELENYHRQECALDKLFYSTYPLNNNIDEVLIKVAALNEFYSTNVFAVFQVAKHILKLNIDSRLESSDETLVDDISAIIIKEKKKKFYSFATKYCSHHKPTDFPIYDSYVDKVLRYYRDRDGFCNFDNKELKDYSTFKAVLTSFRTFYKLEHYNLKDLDKYIWQLGKVKFPRF